MDKHTAFEIWAPRTSPWSPWAKPTLFAHLAPETQPEVAWQSRDVSSLPPVAEHCALVLDLPGAESVELGLALAAHGYRPVPLFNACPAPTVTGEIVQTAVEVGPTSNAIACGASILAGAILPADAPPVFLLDLNRAVRTDSFGPGTFDNRSVVFASDFPSASFLRKQQIRRCVVVHSSAVPIAADLCHALGHWKTGGILVDALTPTGELLEIAWPQNGLLAGIAVRLFAFFRLRRGSQGGFGAFVPESSGG